MADRIAVDPVLELAPEPPPKGPRVWLRDNLFSTIPSGIMSILAIAVVLFAYSGLLAFIFADSRRWDAVTFNTRLLMVQAYPTDVFFRVWLSVAIVAVLLALTFAFWRIGGKTSGQKLGGVLLGLGTAIALGGVLGYAPFIFRTVVFLPVPWLDPGGGPFSASTALGWIIVGVVVAAIGWAFRTVGGERTKQDTIPILGAVFVAILVIVALIWTVELPVPAKIVDGQVITDGVAAGLTPGGTEQTIVRRAIADSTRIPWTIIAAIGVFAYLIGMFLRDRVRNDIARSSLIVAWIASFPVIFLVILRDPDIDVGRLIWPGLAIVAGFAVLGALLLNYIASSRSGEIGRILGAAALITALASFLVPGLFIIRFLLLLLAAFALAAPTFGGEGPSRRRYLAGWVGTVVIVTVLVAVIGSDSLVDVPGNFFLGGLALTLLLSITVIVASFPIGILLALGRTSTMPIFRMISTTYIELVRGVPLITWLLVMFLMFPVALPPGVEVGGVVRAVIAMTFFSAAYLAENVRGGLQSIGKGQYEASKALGMSTAQMTVFITMPQALRAVIPALVGQVIALFKDTSLVTIVGLFDFLHIARAVIPAQSQPFSFLGSIKETLIFAAVVYWLFTFTFSRISQRLEKKLGVGER